MTEATVSLPKTLSTSRDVIPALRWVEQIERLIERFVASWHNSGPILQSRTSHRIEFRREIALTPLDNVTGEPIGAPQLAFGRDISLGGLSFLHSQPIAEKTVAVSFLSQPGEEPRDCRQAILVRLAWCRFARIGTYQSGGTFIREIELPESTDFDRNQLAYA